MRFFKYLQSGFKMLQTKEAGELESKVAAALLDYVYKQTNVGLGAALFCAVIIFMGLLSTFKNSATLYCWAAFFLLITVLRFLLVKWYEADKNPQLKMQQWKTLYVAGSILAGISWGLAGVLLFHDATEIQKTLMILMIAGVTAGAVPLSSAILSAATGFLFFTIAPFIISIFLLNNTTWHLFDAALAIYLLYTITLAIRAYRVTRNATILKYENDFLLTNLSTTKQQLEKVNQRLEHAATHDPLTQVANRSLFRLNLEEAIDRAQKENKLFALFYFDIDNFKPINDMYGHHIGDLLLIVLAERLNKYFGNKAMIARLGGDEFAIIIENISSINAAAEIAQQICQLFLIPIYANDIELKMSASVGVSVYPHDSKNAEGLLNCADTCMYFVKKHGGNNFHFKNEFVRI